ncbi:MAG TPA: hypothetical protein VMC84_01800 [Methanocella sp.]|uniref:hypothetical protein n=1 Tax=Methanocella sp. TaxID=2052833 RepID=UPI002B6BD7AF|nr:hypothetical protein [Methanocella sp.]HTY89887.1 hypothetical protein [Methanocella sp.]
MSDENVRTFVRNTLGCDCDEEVFRHIENEHGASVAGYTLRNKINVGNRLLVYIAEPGDLEKTLPELVNAGRDERDARGYNRFRLVLVSDDAALKERAFKAFKKLPAADEKIHLHVVGKAGIVGL